MSNIGISIAGSVAQGSLQAQQISRALHRHNTDTAAEAKRLRERIDAHLEAVDEGDEANLISQLRIDDQVPERGHPQHQEDVASAKEHDEDTGPADDAAQLPEDGVPLQGGDAAYRPLDITA